jgi:hypothetical protein
MGAILQQIMYRSLQLITKIPKEKNASTHGYRRLNEIFITLRRKITKR